LRLLCLFAAVKSVNQNEDGGIPRRLHYIFKFLLLRVRRLELGLHAWHRFEEAQKKACFLIPGLYPFDDYPSAIPEG